MAQAEDTLEYKRYQRGGRKRFSSESSDYEYEKQKIRNMRKKDLKRRMQDSSSESDTPKGRFMLRQITRNLDRASKVLLEKNSSNRLISRATLRATNKPKADITDYRPAISVIEENISE